MGSVCQGYIHKRKKEKKNNKKARRSFSSSWIKLKADFVVCNFLFFAFLWELKIKNNNNNTKNHVRIRSNLKIRMKISLREWKTIFTHKRFVYFLFFIKTTFKREWNGSRLFISGKMNLRLNKQMFFINMKIVLSKMWKGTYVCRKSI